MTMKSQIITLTQGINRQAEMEETLAGLRRTFHPQDALTLERIGFAGNYIDWLVERPGAEEVVSVFEGGLLDMSADGADIELAHQAFDGWSEAAMRDGYISYRMRFGEMVNVRRQIHKRTHPETQRKLIVYLTEALRSSMDRDDPHLFVAVQELSNWNELCAEAVETGLCTEDELASLVPQVEELVEVIGAILGISTEGLDDDEDEPTG